MIIWVSPLITPPTMTRSIPFSTAAIGASAAPPETKTEPPTRSIKDLSAPRTSTSCTSSPCFSKKPCFQATQRGLYPRVLEEALTVNLTFSCAPQGMAQRQRPRTHRSHSLLLISRKDLACFIFVPLPLPLLRLLLH